MKKLIIGLITGVVLLSAVIVTLVITNNIRESKESLLRTEGEIFAKAVASSYFGWYEENIDVLVSPKVSTESLFLAYKTHYDSLVALNDQLFNVSEYFGSFDSTDSIEGAPDDVDAARAEAGETRHTEDVTSEEQENETTMDSRIIKQGEEYYIPVNSLVFNEEGWDIILFEGSEYAIYSNVVPETFDRMKKNIDYRYNFKDSYLSLDKRGNGFFDVSFTSTVTKTPLLVRLRISDYKYVTFEVRK